MMIFFVIFFFIFASSNAINNTNDNPLAVLMEQKFELLFVNYAMDATRWLEKFNDDNFKNSELGRLFQYEEIKPQIEKSDGRGVKKMDIMMMPLIFHLGVTSTWILVTTIMAAKSVAIGFILLILKIAGSSAKLASYFTAWKGHHHRQWGWTPHHEHPHHESSPAVVHSHAPWAPSDFKSSHEDTKLISVD